MAMGLGELYVYSDRKIVIGAVTPMTIFCIGTQ
jgi:hypothetical protein